MYFQNTPLYFQEILDTIVNFFSIIFFTNLLRKSKYTPVFWVPSCILKIHPCTFKIHPCTFRKYTPVFLRIQPCIFQKIIDTPLYFQNTPLYFKIQGCILHKIHTPVFSRNYSDLSKYTPVFCTFFKNTGVYFKIHPCIFENTPLYFAKCALFAATFSIYLFLFFNF